MKTLKEMFWANGMWRGTMPAMVAGMVVAGIMHLLGLKDNQVLILVVAISIGAFIGLLVSVAVRWLKPVDGSMFPMIGVSRRAMKGLAAAHAVMSCTFLAYFIFDDRTFWLALVVGFMSLGFCVWSIRTLLAQDRWDDDGMLEPKRGWL